MRELFYTFFPLEEFGETFGFERTQNVAKKPSFLIGNFWVVNVI